MNFVFIHIFLQENYTISSPRTENNMVLPWMIPRPSLVKTENVNELSDGILFKYQGVTYPPNLQLALPSTFAKDHSSSSATSSTSKASTKVGKTVWRNHTHNYTITPRRHVKPVFINKAEYRLFFNISFFLNFN